MLFELIIERTAVPRKNFPKAYGSRSRKKQNQNKSANTIEIDAFEANMNSKNDTLLNCILVILVILCAIQKNIKQTQKHPNRKKKTHQY